MFRVKVVGTYIARSGVMNKEKIKKDYEIEGNIPTLNAALSIVKNKLLAPALSAKYADYIAFLTYNIIKITPLDAAAREQMDKQQINFMDRPALLHFVKANALKLDARYYPNLFKLREAVQMVQDDPEGYAKQFALREPDLRLDLEMAAANPELFPQDAGVESGFAASVQNKGQRPKALSPTAHAAGAEDRLGGLQKDAERAGEMGPMDEAPDVGDL